MKAATNASTSEISSFASFAQVIDARLLRALADLAFARPTKVQAQTIPLALEGRDILARAKTGSGKTTAYCIPLVQKILTGQLNSTSRSIRALILVPTRELSEQVTRHLKELLVYCEKEVLVANVSSGAVAQILKSSLIEPPDILVATPSRALTLSQSKDISLGAIETLIIDEADLVLSYGNDEDIRHLLHDGQLPKVYQSLLMSATMTEDVKTLQGLVLRDPVTLELEELDDEVDNLSQFVVRTSEVDKFLLTFVMLRLRLIKGKCILFVNDVDRCYRLKLFLEQFSIKSCVLNSELPLNSRIHIVREFNKGVYDYIIATDESAGKGESDDIEIGKHGEQEVDEELIPTERQEEEAEGDDEAQDPSDDKPEPAAGGSQKRKRADSSAPTQSKKRKASHKRKGKGKDKEYGVTRGVDFIDVSCVLNFDLPTTARGYTHRVGRTARAGRTGMALSFVVPTEEYGKNKIVGNVPSTAEDEVVWTRINDEQTKRGCKIVDYKFDKSKVEAFRYRMEDALRSGTRAAIKEARIKDLKGEVMKSDKLKAHFEDNPMDLEYLRHDKPLHPTRIQPHMKIVPKYLLPAGMTQNETTGGEATASTGFVPFKKPRGNVSGRGRGRQRGGKGGGGSGCRRKKSDPLKKFGK